MSDTLEEVKAAKEEIASLKKEVEKKVKSVFHNALKKIFTENSNLKKIEWRCYTPYFNDGDVCTYRSSHDYADINGVGDYGDDEEDEKAWEALGETEQERLSKVVGDFMKNWDSTDMMSLFGDHVKVTATPAGIETEHYDHD
jgi:hypothetical protein